MQNTQNKPALKSTWWKVALLPVLGLLTLSMWALSSPVGSSPDDNFHLPSIWCGQGIREGYCEEIKDAPDVRAVPMWVSGAACYAYNPESSAGCQTKDFGEPTQLVNTNLGNFNHVYPPVFYWAMSLFTGPNTEISVLSMRLFNSALFVGMVTLTYFLVPLRFRRPVLWGSILAAVPLSLFIIPSTNPSSWAVTSAATLWALLVGFLQATKKKARLALGSLAVLSALVGAGSRADSALFCFVAIAVALILTVTKETRISLSSVVVLITIVAIATLMYMTAGQTSAASTGLGDPSAMSWGQKLYLTIVNLIQVPMIWPGMLGSWGLGWLDTTMPNIVGVASLAAFTGMAFWGLGLPQRLKSDSWRKISAVTFLFLVLWLFPTAVLVQTGAMAGGYFQPRYILPVAIMLVGVMLVGSISGKPTNLARPQALLVVLALSVANVFSIHANMRRYVTGIDLQNWNLNNPREWWWKLPLEPMTVFTVSGLSFGLLCLIVFMPQIFSKTKDAQLIQTLQS